MPYTGQSGQSGGIPYSELRSKYEVTPMGDNAQMAVGDHMRDSLRDLRCSATFFESDHKREDNASESFLSLRHTGHRTGETPDAPDLFLELTDRDPRGTAVDPDMQKLRDMSWDRRNNFRFFSDSSHSVTEREKMPHVIQAQLREQFETTKRRLKIFSMSRESQGTNLGNKRQGDRVATEAQAGNADRNELMAGVRQQGGSGDAIILGWEQTGDADIKVAALGQIRASTMAGDMTTVRSEVAESQRTAESVSQTIKTGAANLMRIVMDRMRSGRRNELATDQTSSESINGAAKTSRFASDRRSRTGTTGITTAEHAASLGTISRFIGQLNRQSGVAGQDIETQLQVVQFMDNAITASRSSSESRFKAENIVLSAKTNTSQAVVARRAEAHSDPLARRNVGTSSHWASSQQVAQLGQRRHVDPARFAGMGEGFKSVSRETTQKRIMARDDALSRASDYAGAQIHQTFATSDRHVRGLGSKYTRTFMDTDRTLDAISEQN